jgi:dihydroorotate dehydrogenase
MINPVATGQSGASGVAGQPGKEWGMGFLIRGRQENNPDWPIITLGGIGEGCATGQNFPFSLLVFML